MGFRYRKSFNLGGGFRVTFSKSGIGYSWGTKGYRITKTANGKTRQTFSIPGTGISYVEEKGKRNNTSKDNKKKGKNANKENVEINKYADYYDVETVSSADVSSLKSDAYSMLFSRIKMVKLIVYGLIILSFLAVSIPVLFYLLLIIAFILSRILRPTIEYEFDEYQRERWEKLSKAWKKIASSKDLQEITLNAKSKDPRRNAGIEHAIESQSMSANHKLPWYLKTNVKPVVFKFKKFRVAIMPDRLIIFDKNFGALDYKDIHIKIEAFGYLVEGKLPGDSELITYVWGYANKDGTPDKRFKNNKQFPIMKYGRFVITSKSGLNIQFMCSNEKAAEELGKMIEEYAVIK